MTEPLDRTSPLMRSGAGLHGDHASQPSGEKGRELSRCRFRAGRNAAIALCALRLEDAFRQIDADDRDVAEVLPPLGRSLLAAAYWPHLTLLPTERFPIRSDRILRRRRHENISEIAEHGGHRVRMFRMKPQPDSASRVILTIR